jgi:hypothetical protein
VSQKSQELLAFVHQLPQGSAYAPIYVKGSHLQSGKESKGKTPLEKSHHVVMGPGDVALQIARKPGIFQAVGVFTGARSNGLVILDVDRNLARLKKGWGSSLDGAPVVTSTKGNAAKYLFRVPEALWAEVRGIGLSDTGAGYEVLWGRQGVIYGAYPGSSDGKAPEGHYGFEGDLLDVPEAPEWLLAEMRDACGKGVTDGGFIKNRKALDFSDRDPGEVAEIIQSALKVIPGQGAGSRDQWVKVGMAIHSELPTDLGLTLWSAWSAEDPEYNDEWSKGSNPCEEVWKSFKRGSVSLGTLFWMADQQMPGRLWLSEDLRKLVADVEGDTALRIRNVTLNYAEVIKRAKELQDLENPAEMAHRMNALALEAGYRDAGALERLLISQIQYEQRDDDMAIGQLLEKDLTLEYLIPDLMPSPGVVMIHGAGGDGKSMTAWTLAKHVARGLPFSIRGDLVPVKQGKVLILNGDQSEVQVKQQMQDLDLTAADPIRVVMGWDLNWYLRFVKLIEKHQPALVIIDSITGCSRGSAFDENRKEFAGPMYWLANNNGRLFPPCTILLIHHSNKSGGFRGTTAIRDAVDEVWSLRKPSEREQEELGSSTRLIRIEKSRTGRGGAKLLLKMLDDLTFELKDYVELTADSSTPASIVDRVLTRLRVSPMGRTQGELRSDPQCGGTVVAIRKALQRLTARGLVVPVSEPHHEKKGTRVNRYFAVLSRDMCGNMCPPTPDPLVELETVVGQGGSVSLHSAGDLEQSERAKPAASIELPKVQGHPKPRPTALPSIDGDSECRDTNSVTPQGEQGSEQRSTAELDALMNDAGSFWS